MDWPNSSSPFPERSRTKSSISSFENSRSPNTASTNFVVSPRGTLKRTAGFTPGVDGLPSRQEQRETRRGPPALGSSSCAGSARSPPAYFSAGQYHKTAAPLAKHFFAAARY